MLTKSTTMLKGKTLHPTISPLICWGYFKPPQPINQETLFISKDWITITKNITTTKFLSFLPKLYKDGMFLASIEPIVVSVKTWNTRASFTLFSEVVIIRYSKIPNRYRDIIMILYQFLESAVTVLILLYENPN